jgi:hypothetical protein
LKRFQRLVVLVQFQIHNSQPVVSVAGSRIHLQRPPIENGSFLVLAALEIVVAARDALIAHHLRIAIARRQQQAKDRNETSRTAGDHSSMYIICP